MSKILTVVKKIICEYILRKPNYRWEMRCLKLSHSAEKVQRYPLGFFNIQFVAKYQNVSRGDPLGQKIFQKKLSAEKS